MSALVTLDFETYYDKDYTLTKLSTSDYIRDPRFEAISCAIKIGNGKTQCFFGAYIKPALAKIDWSGTTLLAHHTHFDGLILSHHYGCIPAYYADTLSMGRGLFPKTNKNDLETLAKRLGVANKLVMPDIKGKHEKDLSSSERGALSAYNIGDVESCYQAYKKMLVDYPEEELDLIDITVRMFADPVLEVNRALAKRELKEEQERKNATILCAIPGKSYDEALDTLSSTPKFCKALNDLGVDIPTKTSKTTGKQIPAAAKTDEELQDLLAHSDPRVVALTAGRLAAKSTISETRAYRLLTATENGWKLPVYLNYYQAHTGRWTGGDKRNFQNFKQSNKQGGKLRESIKAPKGYRLVVVDAAQIEARFNAWLSGQEDILDAFRNKRDIYSEFATTAYKRPISKADKKERFVGKTCVLGLGFQMGAPKLQYSVLTQSIAQGLDPVRLDLNECYSLVWTYRSKYKKIADLWEYMQQHVLATMKSGAKGGEFKGIKIEKEALLLPNGMRLHYPDLHVAFDSEEEEPSEAGKSLFKKAKKPKKKAPKRLVSASYASSKGRTHIYGGLLTENVVQALARIFVASVMVKISKKYRIVMMTHDEIVFMVPAKEADAALAWAIELMSTPPVWAPDIPLSAEGGHDVCYSK